MVRYWYVLAILIRAVHCGEHFSPLKDDIAFQIKWLGGQESAEVKENGLEYNEEDSFVVTSSKKEKYTCTIPTKVSLKSQTGDDNAIDSTPPHALLAPIFKKHVCTYRFEPYWTYELCHGKHLRQYHEERVKTSGKSDDSDSIVLQTESGKKVVVQTTEDKSSYVKTTEYLLGQILSSDIDKEGHLLKPAKWPVTPKEVLFKVIDGEKTPYYPVIMDNGTPCDLKSGSNRRSTVLYICRPNGRNEIISITETSSCEYELIVLSPDLCRNPMYNNLGKSVSDIQCVPINGSPRKPVSLFEVQEALAEQQPLDAIRNMDEPVKNELRRVEDTIISPLVDKSLLKDFLSGTFCLSGGSGWWRFEFCYGKHVHQYHDDSKTGRTTIVVGNWNLGEHEEWTKQKSSRPKVVRPDKTGKKIVSLVQHFYGHGDTCDVTGKPRQVVVQLKCKKDAPSPHAVTIYLLEPTTCQYILGVESLIVCDLLDSADDLGLLNTEHLT